MNIVCDTHEVMQLARDTAMVRLQPSGFNDRMGMLMHPAYFLDWNEFFLEK